MNDGKKYDNGKLRYDLVPFGALEEVIKVLGMGANKYGDDNWKRVDDLDRRYLTAAYRHLGKVMQGEELDEESGLPHVAHAITSLLFVQQARLNKGNTNEL